MEEVIIKVERSNTNEILKKIKKYLRNDQKYLLKMEVNSSNNRDLQKIEQVIKAYNIKDLKKRYTYIYDMVCKDLDEKFSKENLCDFQNNKCKAVRDGHYCNSLYGCCYGPNRGKCKNLINNKCNIKSISCKLFTCRYLRKNNCKFFIRDIPLLNLFFNYRQKYLISYSIFIDEDQIIESLLKLK